MRLGERYVHSCTSRPTLFSVRALYMVIFRTTDIRPEEAIRTWQTPPKSNYRETSCAGVFTSCIVDANWYRSIFTFGRYLRWYRVVNMRVLMSDSLHVLDHNAFRAVYRPHGAHCWKENRVFSLTNEQFTSSDMNTPIVDSTWVVIIRCEFNQLHICILFLTGWTRCRCVYCCKQYNLCITTLELVRTLCRWKWWNGN